MTRRARLLAAGGVVTMVAGYAVGSLAAGPGSFSSAHTRSSAAGTTARPTDQAQELGPYRDSIPGTLVSFDMTPVPAGRRTVEGAAGAEETTVGPFWIGRTEVTWDEYDVFALRLDAKTGAGPDATARPSRPYGAPDHGFGHAGYAAISVTRHAAEAYCRWLSAKTGRTYRLPTDAEWSHVASLAFDSASIDRERVNAVAWHGENSGGRAHPVASRGPDRLGLYDLLGNAAEWVVLPDGSALVRGGSFRDSPERVSPTERARQTSAWNESDPQIPKSDWWLSDAPFVGFRIVRVP